MTEKVTHVPPEEAEVAIPAAQALVKTALNRLSVIGEREMQAGLNIRRITLQHLEPNQSTLFQIVERDIPGWEDGNLWVHSLRRTRGASGAIQSSYASIELPRTPAVTKENIRHLTIAQSVAKTVEGFYALTEQLAEAVQVPNTLFVKPREPYRKPSKELLPIVRNATSRFFSRTVNTVR